MIKERRIAVMSLVVGSVLTVAGGASANDEPTAAAGLRGPTIVLHIVDYAALSPKVLNVAKDRVAMVYKPIGVRIVWVNGERGAEQRQDGPLHLSILLLSRAMAEKTISANGIEDGVLGQAHPRSGRASIFHDRIARAAKYFPICLGDVIAHEVGHLLLGTNSHSRGGIMRMNVTVDTILLRSFEKGQAEAIRTRLMD